MNDFSNPTGAEGSSSKGDLRTPQIERIRLPLKLRKIIVLSVENITPNMVRITFGGSELQDFDSPSPDDHVKLFFPSKSGEEPAKRDYTPRAFSRINQNLVIDFALHEGGVASSWAAGAKEGDEIQVGGPRGSQLIKGQIDHWFLIGDETALPAIGRRVEALNGKQKAYTLVSIPDARDTQSFITDGTWLGEWFVRSHDLSSAETPILERLENFNFSDRTFFWIAGEASFVKSIKQFLVSEKGCSPDWIKASGYWKQGIADSSDKSI